MTTYKDLTDHLVDYLGSTVSGENERLARNAVQNAYRECCTTHRWAYYYAKGRLNTVAPYTTGTVAYDDTGGAYERLLTLTGGIWPSWAAYGHVLVNNVPYQIAERIDDTRVTLTEMTNPGADVAAGTTYSLRRDMFPLPTDFVSMDEPILLNHIWSLNYWHPREWNSFSRVIRGPATPREYSLVGSPDFMGAMSIALYPVPDNIYVIDFVYQRKPRPLINLSYSTGAATATINVATVTGAGTAWTKAMKGSVIRFSSLGAGDAPTGPGGFNPFTVERIVIDVASATSLTMDAEPGQSLTGVKYSISDPVDVEEGAMATLLLRECERQIRILKRIRTSQEETSQYQMAWFQARERDARSFARRAAGDPVGYRPRLRDMPRGADVV